MERPKGPSPPAPYELPRAPLAEQSPRNATSLAALGHWFHQVN